MSFPHDLLTRLADTAPEQHAEIISEALAAQSAEMGHDEMLAAIIELFNDLNGDDGPSDDDTLATLKILEVIADGIQQLKTQQAERTQAATEIGDRLRGMTKPASSSSEDSDDSPTTPIGESGGPQAVAESLPDEAAPVVPEDPAAAPAAPAAPEPVAAASTARVPLGTSNTSLPARRQEAAPAKPASSFESFSLIAAADVPGFATGQQLTGMADVAAAWEARMMPLVTSGVNSGVDGQRTRLGLARIKRQVPDDYFIHDDAEADAKIRFATDERNLPGGSLTASAGWCAPSEFLYDLCPIRMTETGMIDLPTVVARRGGIRYPSDFDWAAVWGSIGFYLTETDVIAGTEKPCIEVPCPEDFAECRMDVAGLCIRTPILMERGWPERVQQFIEGAMIIHAHRMNARKLAKMEHLSTLVQFPAPPDPNIAATITDPHGPGAIESLLSILELQVQYQRYRDRLSQTATLEMVAPYWLRGILKSDLRKKLGIDNRWSVTDATLDAYLRAIGVNPQWVYDWQDSFSEPLDPAGFGGPIPTVWPDSVKIMLYQAGAFFQLTAVVINLDGVYDHASLIQNVYTALFTEEGWQVCIRCGAAYVLDIPLCPNGLSGAYQTTRCTEPAPAA
jgi:hypothetical protein